MVAVQELRLMTRVARLYYEHGRGQSEIARQMHVSQSTVSRMLKRARAEGIVQISVRVPQGVYADLEERLVAAYGLRDAVVADCDEHDSEEAIERAVGEAAAHYLETTLGRDETLGISSWSGTLLAMVGAMRPVTRSSGTPVIQILGGASLSQAGVHAAYLVTRLAERLNGSAVFLPAPGIVGSAEARAVLQDDPSVREVTARFCEVTLALVGIGTLQPSNLVASSGNVFSEDELALLRDRGAVGDVLMRFYDAEGNAVETALNQRVIGMELAQLRKAERAVAVAAGLRKLEAIRGAIRGGLINILVTDRLVAEALLEDHVAESEQADGTEADHGR